MTSLLDIKQEFNIPAYIKKSVESLSKKTNRNTIIYYSGWLSYSSFSDLTIGDMDKNAFMTVCENLNRDKGLDLILHTPGGDVGATESIIDYLNTTFDGDIRAIVPQLAMSGGTMIACSCNEIIMGCQSSLGPVDPQIAGVPAHGVVSEFNTAKKNMKDDPATIPLWQPILSRYEPGFLDSCRNAIEWANEILENSLNNNMFKDDSDNDKIPKIVRELASPISTKNHSRHLNPSKCKDLGVEYFINGG